MYEFFKDDDEKIYSVYRTEELISGDIKEGEFLFSFDGKTIFNFFRDYPQKLTKEQIEIFKKEKPELAKLKKII